MNIFKNRFIFKLIVSICLCVTILSYAGINTIYATEEITGEDEEEKEIFGGILLIPMMELITGIADGVMDIIHEAAIGQEISLVKIDGSPGWWERFGKIVIILLVALVIIATAGAGIAAVATALVAKGILTITAFTVIKLATLTVVGGALTGILVAERIEHNYFPQDIYLPIYNLTPQEIFSNEIHLFDVNFFDPIMTEVPIYSPGGEKTRKVKANLKDSDDKVLSSWELTESQVNDEFEKFFNELVAACADGANPTKSLFEKYTFGEKLLKEVQNQMPGYSFEGLQYIDILYSVSYNGINYKIQFLAKADSVTIKTINCVFDVKDEAADVITGKLQSTARQLRGVVSSWYYLLRNLALLVLIPVLIYIGIKIVIGSTAGEKAKYKERLVDWMVAMCLVFIMHYIMAFALEINEKIIDLVNSSTGIQRIEKVVGLGNSDNPKYENASANEELKDLIQTDDNTNYYLLWETDLMGAMKIKAQEVNEGTVKWVGYAISYMVLVLYTCFFSWTYLKRVVYMAFLTMISPLVAMTYPIDKITDGKAQAFNTWLKEYIFNLLIQPMHLLLYTVLISSAYTLASQNALYSLVAIGFLTPAEALIRKFFGFNKAQTPGLLGGAAGAALAMTGVKSLMKFGQKQEKKYNDSQRQDSEGSNKIKYSNSQGVSAIGVVADEARRADGEKKDAENEELQENKSVNSREKDNLARNNKVVQKNIESNKIKIIKENRKNKRIRRILKASGAAYVAYGRGLKGKVLRRAKNARPIRALARGAVGLAGATGFATAGLALGIASGDPSKAFQYTTAGLFGGYNAGKGIAGAAVDTLSVNSNKMKDELELAWYGDEYKKAKLEQDKKEILKDEDYITYIRKVTGATRREAKELLEGTGSECIDSGIRKVEDIVAVDQMKKEIMQEQKEKGKSMADEEALKYSIAMKKLNDRLPSNIQKMGQDKINAYKKQFEKELKEKIEKQLIKDGKTQNEASEKAKELAKSASDDMMKGIIKFADKKSQLTEA